MNRLSKKNTDYQRDNFNSETPTNLISYDGKRTTSTCYDVRSSDVKDVIE